jgi:hypothetical protein
VNSTTQEAAARVPGEEVTFYSGGCAIAGTFTEAADPVATALLIPGSGKSDRNSDARLPGRADAASDQARTAACDQRIVGREDVGSASGPASPLAALPAWFGAVTGVVSGALGPGLTSESAGAARAVLLTICRPGPSFSGTHRRCRSDLPGLGKRPGFTGPGGQRVRAILNLRKG